MSTWGTKYFRPRAFLKLTLFKLCQDSLHLIVAYAVESLEGSLANFLHHCLANRYKVLDSLSLDVKRLLQGLS